MLRSISVVSLADQSMNEYTSSAATWGELKESEPSIGQRAVGMTPYCKEKKETITSDSYILPTGDCHIYLHVKKAESGNEVTLAKITTAMTAFLNRIMEA